MGIWCVCVCVWCIRGKYKYLCGKQQAFCQNICVRTRSNPHSGLNRFLIPACETDLYPEILFTHPILLVFIDASSQIVLSHSVGKEFLRFCGLILEARCNAPASCGLLFNEKLLAYENQITGDTKRTLAKDT